MSAKPPVPLVTERSPLEEMLRVLPASEAWENKSEDAPVSAKPPVPLVTERSPLEEMLRELPASEAWENKQRTHL